MRALLCGVITGPICTPASRPQPTTRDRAASTNAGVKMSRAGPTVTASDAARQRWPALPKALSATMLVVRFTSASGRRMIGFLAPPWAWTRLPLAEARA